MGIALREVFARFGITFDSAPLAKGAEKTNLLVKALKDLKDKLAAPVLVASVTAFARSMYQTGLELGDTSRALGMSATSLKEWQYVAEASGVPVDAMNSGLQTLTANMRASVTGNYDLRYHFRRLGVDVTDASGRLRDGGDVMLEVGTRITQIQRPITQARYLMMMFGESGRFLLPIFQQGAAAVNAMRYEVRAITGGDFDRLSEQTRKMRSEVARFNLVTEALSTSIFLDLLPHIRYLLVGFGGWLTAIKTLKSETTIFKSLLEILAVVAIAKFVQMGIELRRAFGFKRLGALLAIALLILLFDDLNGALNGNKSLIGKWIDEWQGAGTAARWVQDIKDDIEGIRTAIEGAINAYREWQGLPPIETAVQAQARVAEENTQATIDSYNARHGHPRARTPIDDLGPHYTPTQYQAGQVYTTAPALAPGDRFGAHTGSRVIPTIGNFPPVNVTIHSDMGGVVVHGGTNPDSGIVTDEIRAAWTRHNQESYAAARRALVPVGGRSEE